MDYEELLENEFDKTFEAFSRKLLKELESLYAMVKDSKRDEALEMMEGMMDDARKDIG